MRTQTRQLGQRIEKLGQEYAQSETSGRKIAIMAELAELCSHDAGSSIFMSNGVHQFAGNGGLWPGLGAMLSMIVTRSEAETWKTLRFTDEELDLLTDVLIKSAVYLYKRKEEALIFVKKRMPCISAEELWKMAVE